MLQLLDGVKEVSKVQVNVRLEQRDLKELKRLVAEYNRRSPGATTEAAFIRKAVKQAMGELRETLRSGSLSAWRPDDDDPDDGDGADT